MKILALETTGRLGSVALLQAGQGGGSSLETVADLQTPEGQRTAQSLLPTVQRALKDAAWRPGDVELICVTTGPGSFTGLRIGVVTAKTLAYATGAPLVGVHTLAVLAAGAKSTSSHERLWAIIDAQRQELFVADFQGTSIDAAAPKTEILSIADFLARLAPGDAVVGPPLNKLQQSLPTGVLATDERLWNPSAVTTGQLGAELFKCGTIISPLELVPNYFRKSAAEEKAQR